MKQNPIVPLKQKLVNKPDSEDVGSMGKGVQTEASIAKQETTPRKPHIQQLRYGTLRDLGQPRVKQPKGP